MPIEAAAITALAALSVKAISLRCSETAWHIGDAVVGEWTLQGK